MFNPINALRAFQARINKPIRPIINVQSGGAVINVITKSIEDGNVITDTYQGLTWGRDPEIKASAIYYNGLFVGMGYMAGEEGVLLNIIKDVKLFKQKEDEHGKLIDPEFDAEGNLNISKLIGVVRLAYSGLFSKAIDAQLIEKGSALKSSIGDKILWFIIGCLITAVVMMSWQ